MASIMWQIIERHSSASGIPILKIIGKGRTKHVVETRRAVIQEIRKATALSLVEIGEVFANRHHTTILHYLKAQ